MFFNIFLLVIFLRGGFMNELSNKYELYLELALIINKNMYDDKEISYYLYKNVEDKLLYKIKSIKAKFL